MTLVKGIAEANGTSLYYEATGSGLPIVFIHGMGLDCRMWDHQIEELSKHYRVIRYDLRGFGKSKLPGTENYSQ